MEAARTVVVDGREGGNAVAGDDCCMTYSFGTE